jgi:4-amino-4-deoxy-L-arabinose transferase-like glycosyltransferase
MTQARRFGIADFLLLLIVLGAAGGARAWYLTTLADNAQSSGPLQVQDPSPTLELAGQPPLTEHEALIQNLREHRWFGSLAPFADREEQTAHAAPGYPWLRAWLEQVPGFPVDDARYRWLQAGLGALTAGFFFLFARRAFRSLLVALLAGMLVAVHPFYIINTAELNDGVLATFLLAVSIFLGARGGQSGGALTSLLYGLALAGLALVRAALLPFAFVALLWFLLRSRKVQRGWLCALLAVLGFANGLAPWTLRHWQAFQDVVPIVNSTMLHLWVGYNPEATGGPQDESTLRYALAAEQDRGAEISLSELTEQENQTRRYLALGRLTWEDIQRNPARAIQLRLWAGLYFFFGQDFFQPDHRLWRGEISGRDDWLQLTYKGILWGSLLAMLLLGVLGWRWSFAWRELAMPSSLAVMWLPLPYLLSHAEALSGPRLPLDGVLLSYAALAVGCLLPRWSGQLLRGPVEEPAEAGAAPPAPPPPKPQPAGYGTPRNPFE